MNTKDSIQKIYDCYSNIVAINKDAIKGWRINQHVFSEKPYIKVDVPEPIIDSKKDEDEKKETLTDLGTSAENFVNINSADATNLKTDNVGNLYTDKNGTRHYYVKAGEGTTCAAGDPNQRNDVTYADSSQVSDPGIGVVISKPETDDDPPLDDVAADGVYPDMTAKEPDYSQYYKETQEQFKEALLAARLVFYSKLKDYGASWRIFRPSSVTDQLVIKASRIRNLEDVGVSYVGEGIYPEFQAIVNYGIVALIQFQLGAAENIDFTVDDAMEWYDKIMYETFELMCKKNVDYHEAWRIMRVPSYTDFILVKLARIKQIEENSGQTTVSEGIDANYMDIVNYAVFGLIKLNEQKTQNDSDES